jgi:hypothetical protein
MNISDVISTGRVRTGYSTRQVETANSLARSARQQEILRDPGCEHPAQIYGCEYPSAYVPNLPPCLCVYDSPVDRACCVILSVAYCEGPNENFPSWARWHRGRQSEWWWEEKGAITSDCFVPVVFCLSLGTFPQSRCKWINQPLLLVQRWTIEKFTLVDQRQSLTDHYCLALNMQY